MIQFYAPDILATGTLPDSDSAHCCRVLRMKEGDRLQAVDGRGTRYTCVITGAHHKHTAVEIVDSERVPSPWRTPVTLAVAPTKNNDRMEWLLEKAVEIGVDRVVLLKCDRSERKTANTERMLKVMVSAMKQSLKATLPELVEMTDFKSFVTRQPEGGLKGFGYCDDNTERIDFARLYKPGVPVTIMIGPEGDFSPAEVEMAVKNGFIPVTFGDTRLRTETAALYGLTAVRVLDTQ